MIVRINQIDLATSEKDGGWPATGLCGPLRYQWPGATRVYEVLILGQDEQKRPLPESFRREQLRKLLPVATSTLAQPGEVLVVRVDGPLGELVIALRYLVERDGSGRFAISDFHKLESAPGSVIGSVRIQPSAAQFRSFCTDAALALERSVRMRAFSVPERIVPALVEVNSPDDERWQQILPQCSLGLSTSRGLRSVQIFSRQYEPAELKSRLMRGLLAAAQPGNGAAE